MRCLPLSHRTVTTRVFNSGHQRVPESSRRIPTLPLAALIAACFLALPATSRAQKTWTVTYIGDIVYGGDCTSGTGNTCSLRDAIKLANTNSNDTIVFAPAVMGTIAINPEFGTFDIRKSMTIQGPAGNLVTVSGVGQVTVFAVESGATLQLNNLVIANGNAGDGTSSTWGQPNYFGAGGAIYVNGGGSATIRQCTFAGNSASGMAANNPNNFGGGAILNAGTITVSGTTFSGNTAKNSGGAILNLANGTITNSTFTGNSADIGGAIYNANSGQQLLWVDGTTISGNVDGAFGEGIYEWAANDWNLNITNSIVAGNSSNSGYTGPDCGGNCDHDNSSYFTMIGGDPKLGPLGWNGGPTQTMMPLPGSPVINAGDACAGNSMGLPCVEQDQRGFLRLTPQGASDIGAVQSHYLIVQYTQDSGPGSLRDAIATANTGKYGYPSWDTPIYEYKLGADILIEATRTIRILSPLPEIEGLVNIIGPGPQKTDINGFGVGACELSVGQSAQATVSGLTLDYGISQDDGGVVCNAGQLALAATALSGGLSDGNGGGISTSAGSITTIYSSTISGNTAYGSGGGMLNLGTTALINSTIAGNSSQIGGGGIFNEGLLLVTSSTISQNSTSGSDPASDHGGGILNFGGTVRALNSIVAGNTTAGVSNSDDCYNCGFQDEYNLLSGDPVLSALQFNGTSAQLQTMIPLLGSPALGSDIQEDNFILLPGGLTTDERGFPRTLGGVILDLGAVQTDYTSIQFVQQPTNTITGQQITPAPTVEVMETNANTGQQDAVNGIPLTLNFSGGWGEMTGVMTNTTTNGVATFSGLAVNTPGTGDYFTVSPVLHVTPAQSATFTVSQATTPAIPVNMSVSCWNASFPYGANYQCTVSVSSNGGTPPGSIVYIFDSGSPVFIALNQGNAQFTIPTPQVGSYQVVVAYQQQQNYGPAPEQTESFAVTPAPVNVQLTPSSYYAKVGTSLTFQAAVTAWSTTSPNATGTVAFFDGNTMLMIVPVDSTGKASYKTSSLAAGTHKIMAAYANGTNYGAESATATITLAK